MKTILYSLAVLVSSFFTMTSAMAQYGPPPPPPSCPPPYHQPYDNGYHNQRMQSFYYYPQSNVYYNPAADRYVFFSRNAWIISDRLPHYYRLRREPRFVVYHNGFDVWSDNRMHCAKYREYRRYTPDVAYDRNGSYDQYRYPGGGYNPPEERDNRRR